MHFDTKNVPVNAALGLVLLDDGIRLARLLSRRFFLEMKLRFRSCLSLPYADSNGA